MHDAMSLSIHGSGGIRIPPIAGPVPHRDASRHSRRDFCENVLKELSGVILDLHHVSKIIWLSTLAMASNTVGTAVVGGSG